MERITCVLHRPLANRTRRSSTDHPHRPAFRCAADTSHAAFPHTVPTRNSWSCEPKRIRLGIITLKAFLKEVRRRPPSADLLSHFLKSYTFPQTVPSFPGLRKYFLYSPRLDMNGAFGGIHSCFIRAGFIGLYSTREERKLGEEDEGGEKRDR